MDIKRDSKTERGRKRLKEREMCEAGREEKETDRQTDRQTHRQTNRQTD